MEMDFETGARTDEPEHGQVAWIMTDEQLVRLAYAWNSFGLNEFGWETDNGWFDFHQVIKWKPIENPEEIRLRARVRELERFENIINETGRKFWPAIGTPECRNAIHDPEQRGVFDVLVFINKLLNENSKTE